jgi:hypothetical protein
MNYFDTFASLLKDYDVYMFLDRNVDNVNNINNAIKCNCVQCFGFASFKPFEDIKNKFKGNGNFKRDILIVPLWDYNDEFLPFLQHFGIDENLKLSSFSSTLFCKKFSEIYNDWKKFPVKDVFGNIPRFFIISGNSVNIEMQNSLSAFDQFNGDYSSMLENKSVEIVKGCHHIFQYNSVEDSGYRVLELYFTNIIRHIIELQLEKKDLTEL